MAVEYAESTTRGVGDITRAVRNYRMSRSVLAALNKRRRAMGLSEVVVADPLDEAKARAAAAAAKAREAVKGRGR